MKSYTYKHYDKNGDFIQVIDEKAITSEVSFSESLNSPQDNLDIELNIKWEDANFSKGDYIKVFVNNRFYKNGFQIYYGYINEIERQANTSEQVRLICYGVGVLLSQVFFQKGGNYDFTSTGTADTQIQDILTHFGTQYQGIVTAGDIDTPSGSLEFEFSYDYCLSALNNIVNAKKETHFFFIDRLGKLNFRKFADSKTHLITFQRDIQELETKENTEIINKIHLEYKSGTKIYEDTASIAKYGVREVREVETRVDEATADGIAQGIFEESADPFPEIDVVLNDTFTVQNVTVWDDTEIWDDTDIWLEVGDSNGFEGIEIGDNIKILNRKQETLGFVRKKKYSRDNLQLIIGKYDNLISLIRNDDNTNL